MGVALKDGVYHAYSCRLRGVEAFNVTYLLLDPVPRGRDEDKLPPRPGPSQGRIGRR
jgi:predicted dithiol-disulfide oxidoreductase (DUF899 family)